MDKIRIFLFIVIIVVIVGLFITGFTLSIFRPELLEGTLGNVIAYTLGPIIVLGTLSYFFILIRDKKWVQALFFLLLVTLLLMARSGFLVDVIKQDIRPKPPKPIVQETSNENEETKIKSLFKNTQ